MQFCIYQQHIRDNPSKCCHYLFNVSAETGLVQLELPSLNEDLVLWLMLTGASVRIRQR